MSWFKRLFGPQPTSDRGITAQRVSVTEYGGRFVQIEQLDLFGQFTRSPNDHYRLIYRDSNDEGTRGGARDEGHGRFVLLDGDRLIASGRAERPQDGKVADNGTFIINDWLFGSGLNGRFLAFNARGEAILEQEFAANLHNNGLSPDGRFAVCQTANAPGSPDTSILALFDLVAGNEIARWQPESGWAQSYEFDGANGQIELLYADGERVSYAFDGQMVDRAAWIDRRVASGDLTVIRSLIEEADSSPPLDRVCEQILKGLDHGASTGDVRSRARALRLKGELLERVGKPGEALETYDQALLLDPQVGASRRAEKLRKATLPAGPKPSGRKISRFQRQAEKLGIEHEVVILEAGEAKQWRLGPAEPWTLVEEAVLSHYQAQGWNGVAAEGGLILTLIKAASFKKLDVRNADTFIEALYAQNVAFAEDRFDPQRLINNISRATLGQIERNWAVISATAGETPAFYPRVRWEHVAGLFEHLGNDRLTSIAKTFANAPYDLRAGWPDLTLWRDGEVRFVEVKAPSDQLHASQTRLISTILLPLGFRTGLAEVRTRRPYA